MEMLDCGDHSCQFAKDTSGQRTNGGCRCLKAIEQGLRSKIHHTFYKLKSDCKDLDIRAAALQVALDKSLLQVDQMRKALEQVLRDHEGGHSPCTCIEIRAMTDKRNHETPNRVGGAPPKTDAPIPVLDGPCGCQLCVESRASEKRRDEGVATHECGCSFDMKSGDQVKVGPGCVDARGTRVPRT